MAGGGIGAGYELDDRSYLTLVGRSTHDSERELLRNFGASFPLIEFRSRWSALWHHLGAEHTGIPLKAGLLEFLSFVEGQQLPIAVATSSDRDYTDFSLRHAGLLERFSIVVTGDQVANGKPAPDIYVEAARHLGVEPSQCAALEDSDAGIWAANQAAMLPLLVPDLKPPSEEATKAAFRVLRSLREAQQYIFMLLTDGHCSDSHRSRPL